MWLLMKHVRAFLLSATVLVTLLKFNDDSLRVRSNNTGNNLSTFGGNYFDAKRSPVLLKRKKYKHLILNRENEERDNETNIYILGLFELSTKYGVREEGMKEVHAAQMAVDHVNRRDLLNGHQLKLIINDTQCDPGTAIDRFFHALYSNKTIVMVLGSGCSNVTESLANIVPYWNILQVSFGSLSPTLSDRNKFPLFFRTIAPDSSLNKARLAFIRHFKWHTVAIFSQRENEYMLPLNNLVAELEKENVSCAAIVTFSVDNYREQLVKLKDLDIRIIIASFASDLGARIFCQINKLSMFGADYLWILQEPAENWWRKNDVCRASLLAESLEGTIFLSHYNVIPERRLSVSGLSNEGFARELNRSVPFGVVRETYDAVWTMALLLSDMQKADFDLLDFYYDNDEFVDQEIERITFLEFMGVSGPVKFNGADRVGNSVIKQLQGGNLRQIAVHYAKGNRINFACSGCFNVTWKGGRSPITKRILKTKLVTIPKIAFYTVTVVSLLGITASIFFLYFNVRFRKVKVVKLSSPKLNNIVVIGCIMVYTAIILLGLDKNSIKKIGGRFSQMCTVRVYLLSAGFSLAFGSMFAKTYRVHRIFTYSCTSLVKDKILKDKQLISLILFLLIIDGVIVTFWIYIDPLQRGLHNLTVQVSSEDRSVLYQTQVEICRCNNTTGWFIAMYGYKGFLLIMGVYMAWETRHIKVEPLNDSRYIGVCVYSVVFSSIIVLLSNFFADYVLLAYLVRTVSILVSATVTLLLLFVPKLKAVYWDGEQDPIMQSMGLKIECNTRRLLAEDPKELTYRLEVQNKVYKCEIEALDKDIARLKTLLNENDSVACTLSKSARASWPSTLLSETHTFRNNFLSETNLNEDKPVDSDESEKIFSRLRHFFGRIPSVWLSYAGNSTADVDEGLRDNGVRERTREITDHRPVNPPCGSAFYISLQERQIEARCNE